MKLHRHKAIRDLLARSPAVAGEPVSNQDELRRRLAVQGIHVTQATLSRDIRELRLTKGPEGYALPAVAEDAEDELPEIGEVLHQFGLEVRQAENLLVLVTVTSGAQPVAARIDWEEWPEVVGTIAGDNTVLVICPETATASSLRLRLETYIG